MVSERQQEHVLKDLNYGMMNIELVHSLGQNHNVSRLASMQCDVNQQRRRLSNTGVGSLPVSFRR